MTTPSFPKGDLQSILDYLATAERAGALVRCDIRAIQLGREAVRGVADAVAGVVDGRSDRPTVLLLVDATPIRRQGEDLKKLVHDALAERFEVRTKILTEDHPPLHADERAVEAASAAATGVDAVVTVGGGTITDLGKMACRAGGGIPQVAVQTAASVDGFTDNVSVVLRAGVKRTVPSRWPDVVIADVEVIRGAPADMNRAGFGEFISMFTAPADWRLADLLGLDTSFHPAPVQLLNSVGAGIADWSAGVAAADVAAVERLTWALAVRGIATGVSGTTACLSGVEHLVSHMLDLHRGEHGLALGLHGAQVGVAAVVASVAWEMLFERLSDQVPSVRLPDPDQAQRRVDAAFAHLGPGVVAECWRDYSAKLAAWADQREAVEAVLSTWSRAEAELRPLIRPSAQISSLLQSAAAPTRFAELEPDVSPELAHWAVTNCAFMRNRSTVVDLLAALGWWEPDDVAEVLARSQRPALESTAP